MKKRSLKLVVLLTAVLLAFGLAAAGCGGKEEKLPALEKPASLAWADNTLSWQEVTGADNGYAVKVTKGSETVLDETVTTTSVTLTDPAAGDYSASVTARGVEGKYLASPAATLAFTVSAPPPPEKTKLAAPQLTYVRADQTVTWTAVEGATGYRVSAVKAGTSEVTIAEKTVTGTTLDVTGLTAAEHTITAVALAGDSATYLDSDPAAFNLTILSNPLPAAADIVFTAETDTLSWTAVEGADAYDVTIKQNGTRVAGKEVLTSSFDTSALGKGDFTAEIKVFAPQGSIYDTDSALAEKTFTIAAMGDLAAPTNIRVESGSVMWDPSDARGFGVTVVSKATGDPVSAEPVVKDDSVVIAAMNLPDGGYTVSVKATSNRHNQTESAAVTQDVWVSEAASYSAADIANFDGTAPVGEHAAVELVTVGGVSYARVRPTADGWGRLGGPATTLDFDLSPVVFMEMGEVLGGYHLQIQYAGSNYVALKDSLVTESSVVDLVKGLKSEASLDIAGIKTVRLRLGVDHSIDNADNDARANYKAVSVLYVTDHSLGLETPTKLAAPKLAVSDGGQLTWQGVQYANLYDLTVKNTDTQAEAIKTALSVTVVDLFDLPDGHYEASVVAKHASDPNALPSDAGTVGFTVSTAANYTPEQMDTATGIFEPAENGLEASYNAETGFVTLNSSVPPKGYGWIYPRAGIEIDFNRNPVILVTVESGTEGGYLARAIYDGSPAIVMKNDTPGAITSRTVISMRAGYNVDGNPAGTGVKTGYKFGMGVRGDGVLQLSGMKIVYFYQDEDLTRPETPVKLSSPGNIRLDRAKVVADAVRGNSVYAPLYDITVTEKGQTQPFTTLTGLESPAVILSGLGLTSGKTYAVSVTAKGDTDAKPYFADSDAAVIDVMYTELHAVTDFTGMTGDPREADAASEIALTADEAGLKITVKKGTWGFMAVPIVMDKTLLTESAVLEFVFGDAVGNPQFSTRYYDAATGSANKACTGDQWIPAGKSLYDTNLYNNATFVDIGGQQGFYLGIGHGGAGGTDDSAVKEYTITRLVIAQYSVAA